MLLFETFLLSLSRDWCAIIQSGLFLHSSLAPSCVSAGIMDSVYVFVVNQSLCGKQTFTVAGKSNRNEKSEKGIIHSNALD